MKELQPPNFITFYMLRTALQHILWALYEMNVYVHCTTYSKTYSTHKIKTTGKTTFLKAIMDALENF